MRERPKNKRHAAALREYGRACVAMQRMSRDVQECLAKLYYSMQRKDITEVRYHKAAKALTKARGGS